MPARSSQVLKYISIFGGIILATLALVALPSQRAWASNVTLQPGQTLYSGQSISTGSGCDLIVQSTDGDVVEYCNGSAVWASNTGGYPGDYLAMQGDGNLVIYSAGGTALWQTGTFGYSGSFLALQDDENLVVYDGGTPLWASSSIHSPSGAQTYSQYLFAHYGWNISSQWTCLYDLWQRESGREWNATNPSSGAYGIPQALPAGKLASAGADWQNDGLTQVQWGENYIYQTYGSPCAAWNHEIQYGWYIVQI